jgi:hypothetical protein
MAKSEFSGTVPLICTSLSLALEALSVLSVAGDETSDSSSMTLSGTMKERSIELSRSLVRPEWLMRLTLMLVRVFELCEDAVSLLKVLGFDFLVVGRFGQISGSDGESESYAKSVMIMGA